MHDPNIGLGMDAYIHLWHPCKATAKETRHNGIDWVDVEFERHIDVAGGTRSLEQVRVQVRQEVAKDLMCRLIELFPVEVGRMICKLSEVTIREEETCQSLATAEES